MGQAEGSEVLPSPCSPQLHLPPSSARGSAGSGLPLAQTCRAPRTYWQRVDPPDKELIATRSRERKELNERRCPGPIVSHNNPPRGWHGPPHPLGPCSRVRPPQSCHSSQRTPGQQLLQALRRRGRTQGQSGHGDSQTCQVSPQGQKPFTYSLRTLPDSGIAFSKLWGEDSQD